jgi:hypothetical protein
MSLKVLPAILEAETYELAQKTRPAWRGVRGAITMSGGIW